MENRDRELLILWVDLAQKQQGMINELIPVIREVADVLVADLKPTHEQLERWQSLHARLAGDMSELTESFESLVQSIPRLNQNLDS